MEQNITYHLYTIAQLREYLLHNAANGISLDMISNVGGYALINNPCAKDDDIVISAAMQNNEVVGYTAVFAEQLVRPDMRLFWGSSEWVDVRLRGKGIAATMMRNIKDAVNDVYFGMESSPASVKLDLKQGSKVCYFTKYHYRLSASKGIHAQLKSAYINRHNTQVLRNQDKADFEIRYINFIDDSMYAFMQKHSMGDLFFRKREMFNWMLTYPYQLSTFADEREIENKCEYWPNASNYQWIAIDILQKGERIGIALFTKRNNALTLRYIYHDEQHEQEAYAAILHVIFKIGAVYLYHCSASFAEYLSRIGIQYMDKEIETPVSFTYPADFSFDQNLLFQGGDGDMFC